MSGDGKVSGNLAFTGGTIEFTDATTLTVTGNFSQSQNAVLDYHYVDGWGRLAVGGSAALNGQFTFSVVAGNPGTGWYDIVNAPGGVSGTIFLWTAGYDLDTSVAGLLKMRKP